MDLRTFLKWVAIHLGYSFLTKIVAAPPTAEVEPIRSNYSQTCRSIISSTGFVVLDNLLNHIAESVLQMGTKLTRAEVADKVKYYSIPSIDGQGRLAQVVRVTLEGSSVNFQLNASQSESLSII
ncbi:hypothetical protein KY289_028093 [Solanum tuberosum]|nr:hypothetical protein KY289_028093 [Solanum tuberosum]